MARLQYFETYSGTSTLIADASYRFQKVAEGNSKVSGMLKYVWESAQKNFSEGMDTIYLDKSLTEGREGRLVFTGSGYRWDWNSCQPAN